MITDYSDDNADARFREYLLDQAKEQIKFSAQDRRVKVCNDLMYSRSQFFFHGHGCCRSEY
jgi:hypothetical protein